MRLIHLLREGVWTLYVRGPALYGITTYISERLKEHRNTCIYEKYSSYCYPSIAYFNIWWWLQYRLHWYIYGWRRFNNYSRSRRLHTERRWLSHDWYMTGNVINTSVFGLRQSFVIMRDCVTTAKCRQLFLWLLTWDSTFASRVWILVNDFSQL